MADFDSAVLAMRRAFAPYQKAPEYRLAYLGDGNGNVYTSQANWYRVRYPLTTSPYVEMYGGGANIPAVEGVRVIIGYTIYQPNVYQIISVADGRLDVAGVVDGADITATTSGLGYSNVSPHDVNHAYLGPDPTYVNWRQITPLGTFPYSGMTVRVWPGYIPRPGADTFVYQQDIDLTSHIPAGAGEARYALISFDATGAVVVTDGTINAGGFSALTTADIPNTPAGNWRSAAVVLYNGMTAVQESRAEINIFDLRFPEESTAGSISPGDIPLTSAHIIVGNGSNVGADVAMSQDATISNTGAVTIANQAVTYAKMQNISATQRALGRNTAGAGSTEEVTASQLIDWLGSTRGAILYRGASGWAILTPGTSGYVLTSNGAGADPSYQQTALGAINVYNETLGANGVSTIYHLANYAAPGTIRVYINGIRQPATDDTVATDIVQFSTAPSAGALLMFDYELEIF